MKTTFEIINFYWGTLNLVDSKININAALILPNDPFLILTSKDNTVYFSKTTHLFNSLFWLYRAFNILPSVHSLLLIPCRLGCWFAVSLICLFLKKKKIFLFTLNSRVNNFIWLDIDLFHIPVKKAPTWDSGWKLSGTKSPTQSLCYFPGAVL